MNLENTDLDILKIKNKKLLSKKETENFELFEKIMEKINKGYYIDYQQLTITDKLTTYLNDLPITDIVSLDESEENSLEIVDTEIFDVQKVLTKDIRM